LGLAIASEAIRMHGGTVSAANLPGEGLEVRVRLPAAIRSASPKSDSPQSHVIQS
jgi:signal transduction histidine kinase